MMEKKKPRFLRSDTRRHLKLGSHRRKLQKWRRPRGRHSKIRRHRTGYPLRVSIGYSSPREGLHLVQDVTPVLVHTLAQVDKLDKNSGIIVARIGARKRIEIIKKANEKGIKILNLSRESKK